MMYFFDENNQQASVPDVRVEGEAKVTGKAKYAAEYKLEGITYAVLVDSKIAAGKIKNILVDHAKQADGVIDIISHLNKPSVPGFSDENKIKESRFGLPIFHTDKIYFKGQPIALVIAKTLDEAIYAASLVEAEYDIEPHQVDFDAAHPSIPLQVTGNERGQLNQWENATHIIDEEYNIKSQVHNPMEMHATIAHWTANDKLVLYDKNQGVNNVQRTFSRLFEIPTENIQVYSEFVGGGFGAGLKVWPHALAAIMGAKHINKPVKLMLTRPQMFYSVGYRPQSWQRVKFGTDKNGKFLGVHHQARNVSSIYENFNDGITRVTRLIYNINNLKAEAAIVPLNLSVPTWMRGPGDCTGDFAIESAIDELSYKLNMDPYELRMKNLALDKNPETGLPWSTNFIHECMEMGAKMINWKDRKSQPKQIKEGDWYIGYGMAVGMWNAGRGNASAAIEMQKDGSILVQSAMTDIGTGTGISMQNIAHTSSGISKHKIKIELGNSKLPSAPSQGGSNSLSSISGAIAATVDALKINLAKLASSISNEYSNAGLENIVLNDNGISLKNVNNSLITYTDIFDKHQISQVIAEASSGPGAERQKFSFCSAAAHFCKVRVNVKTGKIKIDRLAVVADGGKIISPKAAANQMSGAAVGGIGMTLMEEQLTNQNLGSLVGHNFAGYHFPVNADVPMIEVAFVNKPDLNINPSGSKGLGEVGIVGTAPAITNAIYNAIGKRFRNLPVSADKVLTA